MKTRCSRIAVLSLLILSTASVAAAQEQPLPPPPPAPPLQQPAPSSSAPHLQLESAPFPSAYTPASPTAVPQRSWQVSRGSWGAERERPAPAPETQEVWYGWQTLLTDALALGTVFASPELGIGTYALGAPIVHWGHGNVARGFGSLLLRTGAPFVLGLGGGAMCDSSHSGSSEYDGWECLGPMAIGVLLGVATAVVVDSAVIARETVPVEKTTFALGPVKMMPSVGTTGKQTTLSLSGTF